MLVLDQTLCILSANASFYQKFSTTAPKTEQRLLYEIANGRWDIASLRKMLEEVLRKRIEIRDFRVRFRSDSLDWRTLLLNARAMLGAAGQPQLILLAIEDVTERFQNERAALTLREREHLGRELHDSVGQRVTAIGLLAASLQQHLRSTAPSEVDRAGKLLEEIEQAKQTVRELAKGLLPVEMNAEELICSLQELAEKIRLSGSVACRFDYKQRIPRIDDFVAAHLFRIAQEAVVNAVKHSRASEILLQLVAYGGRITLRVRDNGVGMPSDPQKNEGMGIPIMQYRCREIDGVLSIERGRSRGSIVACSVAEEGPIHDEV
jgi:signal transduction histidine kinase